MSVTQVHLAETCIGKRLFAVNYFELEYSARQDLWNCEHDYDSLDYGLELEFSDGSKLPVFWGADVVDFSLLFERNMDSSSFRMWDVSSRSRWRYLINCSVVGVEMYLEKDESTGNMYPQDLALRFDNGKTVYISALEIGSDNCALSAADHVTVFFDEQVARTYCVGPYRAGSSDCA